jgi:hypothetical protein
MDKKLFKIYLIKTTDSSEGLVLCDVDDWNMDLVYKFIRDISELVDKNEYEEQYWIKGYDYLIVVKFIDPNEDMFWLYDYDRDDYDIIP